MRGLNLSGYDEGRAAQGQEPRSATKLYATLSPSLSQGFCCVNCCVVKLTSLELQSLPCAPLLQLVSELSVPWTVDGAAVDGAAVDFALLPAEVF